MKNISKDTLESASNEYLQTTFNSLKKEINESFISWKNAAGNFVSCPWNAFNAQGAVVVNREQDPAVWDLGRKVQMRAEAERQNAGNLIASFKSVLNIKANNLTATVKTAGLSRTRCPVMDQLAECLSYLSNASKVAREIFDRAEKERQLNQVEADKAHLAEQDAERQAVAADLAAKAKAKAEKAVKDAFKDKKPETEGNGQPVLVTAGA